MKKYKITMIILFLLILCSCSNKESKIATTDNYGNLKINFISLNKSEYEKVENLSIEFEKDFNNFLEGLRSSFQSSNTIYSFVTPMEINNEDLKMEFPQEILVKDMDEMENAQFCITYENGDYYSYDIPADSKIVADLVNIIKDSLKEKNISLDNINSLHENYRKSIYENKES